MPRIVRSFMNGCPPNPPVAYSRSRSHRVSPCLEMSRSGCERCLYSKGSMSAIRCPHPVGVDQLLDAGGLGDLVVMGQRDVLGPADRLVRNAQRAEHVDVEIILAQ